MRGTGRLVPLAALLLAAAAGPGQAQEAEKAGGVARSVLDGVFTPAQATSGKKVFGEVCAACHSSSQFGQLARVWGGRTVYDVFEQIRTTMPFDGPGRLSRQEYVDVVAYIISINGYPSGERALDGDLESLKRIRIEARQQQQGEKR